VRVAALYDIHGNLPALEAVLAELARLAPDAIVVGGDVAAGPFPCETLDRLRALSVEVRFVRGNADRELAEALPAADPWVLEQLDDADRAFLRSFEPRVVLDVEGLGATLFCHGSPRSDEEILTRATSEERLARVLADVPQRVVVCGHTHVQFDRLATGLRVVNAGSVGMPYESGPGAYWALLGPGLELRRTLYDLEGAAEAIRASSWPGADAFVRENLLVIPTADEATAYFEGLALERDQLEPPG